jgi:hypothetical protein
MVEVIASSSYKDRSSILQFVEHYKTNPTLFSGLSCKSCIEENKDILRGDRKISTARACKCCTELNGPEFEDSPEFTMYMIAVGYIQQVLKEDVVGSILS